MLGLEHHAHAAGAELVEHHVLAEHQVLMLARVDDLGLVLGELALADEQLGQCLAVGWAAARAAGARKSSTPRPPTSGRSG